MVKPVVRKKAVARMCVTHGVSQRRACEGLTVERSSVRYKTVRPDAAHLREIMKKVAAESSSVWLPAYSCDTGAPGFPHEPKEVTTALC